MFDTISDTLKNGLLTELGLNSVYYSDYLIDNVHQKTIQLTMPNRSLGIIELPSTPPNTREIGSYGPADWSWYFEIELLIKSMDEKEAREQRRILTRRIRTAIYRPDKLGKDLLALSVNDGVFTERVKRVDITRISPINAKIEGKAMFAYIQIFDLSVFTNITPT